MPQSRRRSGAGEACLLVLPRSFPAPPAQEFPAFIFRRLFIRLAQTAFCDRAAGGKAPDLRRWDCMSCSSPTTAGQSAGLERRPSRSLGTVCCYCTRRFSLQNLCLLWVMGLSLPYLAPVLLLSPFPAALLFLDVHLHTRAHTNQHPWPHLTSPAPACACSRAAQPLAFLASLVHRRHRNAPAVATQQPLACLAPQKGKGLAKRNGAQMAALGGAGAWLWWWALVNPGLQVLGLFPAGVAAWRTAARDSSHPLPLGL